MLQCRQPASTVREPPEGGSRAPVASGAGWLSSCRSGWSGILNCAVRSAYLQKWWLQGAANMSMVV